MMRIGSLCSGIGGLELGLQLAGIQTETVFVSDIDAGANRWLEANVEAPNLGDFTALDELPEVDIITAGFPCQPFSTAGMRAGLNDERYLFDDIARLASRMGTRPLLFLENVPGLLTANGGNAMARVVHQLAAIGYQLTYGLLPAAAVGAPHRRLRWWGLAYPQDADSKPRYQRRIATPRQTQSRRARPDAGRRGRALTSDTNLAGSQTWINTGCWSERLRAQPVGFAPSPADTHKQRLERRKVNSERTDQQHSRPSGLETRFGPYAAAVRRWETVLGRQAPDPTIEGRLSQHFVEWMMGFPKGWATNTLDRRTPALHALGNAVVPQCAALAFTQLTERQK